MTMVSDLTNDELMAVVVRPAIERLFRDGEIDGVELEERADGHVLVHVRAGEDECGIYLRTPGAEVTVDHQAELIVGELQDFIAESSFGWGQLRT